MDYKEAIEKLFQGPLKSFLNAFFICLSSTPGYFILSVNHKETTVLSKIKYIPPNQQQTLYYQFESSSFDTQYLSNQRFSSLEKLVKTASFFLKGTKITLVCKFLNKIFFKVIYSI